MSRNNIWAATSGGVLAAIFAGMVNAADEPVLAKDIVLSRLNAPISTTTGTTANVQLQSYGMSVSVLVIGSDGLLRPRAADTQFQTGEKFRLRVLPTQDGTVVISNTNPQGVTHELLRMSVRSGQETLIPAEADNLFQLAGASGEDALHVQLYPVGLNIPPFSDTAKLIGKDIRLVTQAGQTTQSSNSASYVVGQPSQPLYTRVVVRH